MVLLIDAEPLLYRAAAGAEYEVSWDNSDSWTYQCNHGEAKAKFEHDIAHIEKQANCPGTLLLFSDKNNFRYGVDPSYKGNRKKRRKPSGYEKLVDWCSTHWFAKSLPNVEADDAIGILYKPGDVISSRDKDLKTVPGLHLTEEGAIEEIPLHLADLTFFMQVLTGDAADGYPGCKGMGPVGAAKALAGASTNAEYWEAVLAAYLKAGKTPQEALVQARLARILRAEDYDLEAQRVKLWSPSVGCN